MTREEAKKCPHRTFDDRELDGRINFNRGRRGNPICVWIPIGRRCMIKSCPLDADRRDTQKEKP